MTPQFFFAYIMQIHRARTYQKIKKFSGLIFFLQFNMCDIMVYIRVLASATRLQQRNFPPIVATKIGKQRSRHCPFILIKKQKTYPFTFSSVAMTPHFFFAYRMQIHRARTYQKVKKFSGLVFFLQFFICYKLPYICVQF